MTPAKMAQIHRAAFLHERSWAAEEFTALLTHPQTTAYTAKGGFALTRTIAGETELLTLAVAPDHQRRGMATRLLVQWINAVRPQADTAFLEVAADNHAAQALYARHGFAPSGQRKAYYKRTNSAPVDAVLMTRSLTQG